MKKIMAAVAAAVIAPVSTMAAGPTLYGKIHMSVNYLDNNAGYDSWSLNSNASRIGVKGSEDLGNGMKVGYLIEWSVGMDGSHNDADASNAKDLNLRNRAVTVSSGWGTILAGQWDTPFKVVGRKVDMFGERLGDNRNLGKQIADIDLRTPNTVAYTTPNMAGFSATAAYSFDVTSKGDTSTADDTDFHAWAANAMYNNGPFYAGLAYQQISSDVFGEAGSSTTKKNQNAWRLAGSWNIGEFKVLGSYTGIQNGNGLEDNDPSIATLGAAWKFGNNTLKGQYGWRSSESFALPDDEDADNTGAQQWVIGLDHDMSKRTALYAEYGTMYNDDMSDVKVWGQTGNSASAAEGEDNQGFGLGIIHKF